MLSPKCMCRCAYVYVCAWYECIYVYICMYIDMCVSLSVLYDIVTENNYNKNN